MMSIRLEDLSICLVCLSDNPDHQEVIYSLHRELLERGYRVFTVGIKDPKTSFFEKTETNVLVDCPKRPGLAKGTFNLANLVRVIKTVRSLGASIIYFETVHVWNLPLELALRKSATIFEVIHDVDPHDGSFSTKLASLWCARLADYTVIRNNKDQGRCAESFGIPLEKILSLESWRAFPPWQPLRHTGTFLFFGRLRKYKGLQALFHIAQALPEVNFKVVGQSDKDSLETVTALSLLSNVEVDEGFADPLKMENSFLNADWVVVPYESASQSGIIMDAYRYARPVIAFDVGALSEQVEDGKTGYLVEKGDLDGFVEAIRTANALDVIQLKEKSQAAYEFGIRRYSSKGAADRFIGMVKGAAR